MRLSVKLFLLSPLVLAFTTSSVIKNSGGKTDFSGAPGEGTCNGCHGGGSSISSSCSITANPAFTGNQYVPGATYTITASVNAIGFNHFGFDCTILNAANTNAGTMQNPGSGVNILNGGTGRKNATQSTPKNGTNGTNFTFEWVAPVSGNTTIYLAGNAVNLNGGTSGDLPINTSLALTASPSTNLNSTGITQNKFNVYPNPTNGYTSISYSLTNPKTVSIQLININGSLVKEFLNENQIGGNYSNILNLEGLEKGLYFLTLSGNNERIAQKLITVN
jgi:hypothetical protein